MRAVYCDKARTFPACDRQIPCHDCLSACDCDRACTVEVGRGLAARAVPAGHPNGTLQLAQPCGHAIQDHEALLGPPPRRPRRILKSPLASDCAQGRSAPAEFHHIAKMIFLWNVR